MTKTIVLLTMTAFTVDRLNRPDKYNALSGEMFSAIIEAGRSLAEAKAQTDPAAPLPPVLPIVVSHAPGGWTAPTSFHQLLDPAVLREVPRPFRGPPRTGMLT